jgi:hypothetical protein
MPKNVPAPGPVTLHVPLTIPADTMYAHAAEDIDDANDGSFEPLMDLDAPLVTINPDIAVGIKGILTLL